MANINNASSGRADTTKIVVQTAFFQGALKSSAPQFVAFLNRHYGRTGDRKAVFQAAVEYLNSNNDPSVLEYAKALTNELPSGSKERSAELHELGKFSKFKG